MSDTSTFGNIIEKYGIEIDCRPEQVLTILERLRHECLSKLTRCLSRDDESHGVVIGSNRSSISSVSEFMEYKRRRTEHEQIVTNEIDQLNLKIKDLEQDIRAVGDISSSQTTVSVELDDPYSDTRDCTESAAMMDGSELEIVNRKKDTRFTIIRPVYTQQEFDLHHGGTVDKPNWRKKCVLQMDNFKNRHCTRTGIKDFTLSRLPFIIMLMKYDWKKCILADFVAGLIVGVMHIPQGMGYTLLVGLEPQYGLYVSFFPAVSYFFFGTSRHVSMGTVAVVSLLSGNFLDNSLAMFPLNATMTGNMTTGPSLGQLKASRAAGLTLCVGLIHLLMGIFKLGFLTRYLSDPLVSGFTVGAAISVFTSQVTSCLGISIPKQSGNFNIPMTYYQVFKNITSTNMVTLALTLICIAILVVTKQYINPRVVKKIRVPIPMDLILVIIGTGASYSINLYGNYKVKIVGTIIKGLPAPVLPDVVYMSSSIADLFVTAIISFSISISLAKIFSKKHCYPIDANQECLSYGIMNVFSSFFLCFPAGASLSRSAVQESIGGKTQVTSIIASILVLFVVLFLGPLFYSLPICVLASIIVVALKGMFMQFVELKELWRFSYWDFSIWVITFLVTVIVDVQYGLMAGLALCILIVMLRTQSPNSYILGQIVGTDLYKNILAYDTCKEVDGIKIFRYEGSLYYASAEHFRKTLYKKVSCNPRIIRMAVLKLQKKMASVDKKIGKCDSEDDRTVLLERRAHLENLLKNKRDINLHYVIIDCSTWGYIDTVGVKTLHQVIAEFKHIDVTVLLANPKTDIRGMFAKSKCYKELDNRIVFVSVHDAVINSLYDHKKKMEERDSEI